MTLYGHVNKVHAADRNLFEKDVETHLWKWDSSDHGRKMTFGCVVSETIVNVLQDVTVATS